MNADTVAERAWALRVNLMRVAMSILHHSADAEDAVSATLFKAYCNASKVSDEKKLNAWLMRIVVLACYDILRHRKRQVPVGDVSVFDRPVFTNADGTIWESICKLPGTYQKVLVLYYYEGFKAREIAHILSMPTSTVLVHLSRGRSKLKQLIIEPEGVAHGEEQTI